MTRAEKAGLEAYPENISYSTLYDTMKDYNAGKRKVFVEGYEQGYKEAVEETCKWLKKEFKAWNRISVEAMTDKYYEEIMGGTTMMDTYEKKYKDLLNKAKKLHDENCDGCKVCLETIFPELAETEDERTRQQILNYFMAQKVNEPQPVLDSWIAWLEKQAQKPKWTEEDSLMIDSIIDTIKWLEGKGATNMKIDWLTSLKQRMEE